MVQRGGSPSFPAESFERLRILGDIAGEEFQRNEATEVRILSFVDHAHSAATEFLDDAIVRNCPTDRGVRFRHARR